MKVDANPKDLRVGIVIPALNEAGAIGGIIEDTKKALKEFRISIVVVDGGSTDDTVDAARKLGTQVVKQCREGYGDALTLGFEHASRELKSDVIVMLDADGTYDPSDIPKLLRPILDGEADIVIGNRLPHRLRGSMTLINRIGNGIISWLTAHLFGLYVSDTQCGMRAFSADLVPIFAGQAKGMSFATEMLIDAHQSGARIEEVQIVYRPRVGKTKLNPLKDGASILGIILRLLRDYKPLLFFGGLGLGFMIVGVLEGLAAIREWILFGTVTKTATAILSALLIIMSVQFLSVGLVADMMKGMRSQERDWFRRMLAK